MDWLAHDAEENDRERVKYKTGWQEHYLKIEQTCEQAEIKIINQNPILCLSH